MKSKIFKNQHIRVEIRMPQLKHLDVEDEVDRQEMIKIVQKEWVQVIEDVNEALGITVKPKSPSLRDMFP